MFIYHGHLIEQREHFLRGQLIRGAARARRGVKVAVPAAQVAALGEVQGDEVRLPVILRGGSAADGQQAGPVDVPKSDGIDELKTVVHEYLLPTSFSMISLRLPVFMASSM